VRALEINYKGYVQAEIPRWVLKGVPDKEHNFFVIKKVPFKELFLLINSNECYAIPEAG
jgi:hypothetical protein